MFRHGRGFHRHRHHDGSSPCAALYQRPWPERFPSRLSSHWIRDFGNCVPALKPLAVSPHHDETEERNRKLTVETQIRTLPKFLLTGELPGVHEKEVGREVAATIRTDGSLSGTSELQLGTSSVAERIPTKYSLPFPRKQCVLCSSSPSSSMRSRFPLRRRLRDARNPR